MGERPESRNVWRSELRKQQSSLSDARKQVLQFYIDWELQHPQQFLNNYRVKGISDPQISFFKKAFDDTTAYLNRSLGFLDAGNPDAHVYVKLLSVHISINARSVEQAKENVKNNVARQTGSLLDGLDPIFQERAYIYTENIPKFVEEMDRKMFHLKTKISYEDIWWILMMRLHAWTMSVNWVDDRGGVKIPSEYYYSPARVYIL
ncbi:unnamed protein product [Alternaria alternata]